MFFAKPDESLSDHTENTLKVFSSLKEGYQEIPELCNVPQFWNNLFYAIFLHDFGKIASGFQEELKTGKRWNYRHEILSAGFVSALDVPEKDKNAIALAIITHHKDIKELREKYATYPKENPGYQRFQEKLKELNLNESNNLIDNIKNFSSKYLGTKLTNYHFINTYEELTDVYSKYVLPYYRAYKSEELTPLHRNYGIFMKGFLTAADHLASAGEYEIKKTVKEIKDYIKFKQLNTVQKQASKYKGDMFIVSPTGSGKTEAALFWAHNNQNPVSSKRIFYILPYTASINYMYKRFIKLFGNDELVAVLHGKSSYFLYRFFTEERGYINYKDAKIRVKEYQSLAKKIYKPYKVMTPFQIIKAFFSLKGFERNISEMAGGLFIFDEIHSYDPHTTALILQIAKFIKEELNGKLLFMTATMPEFLKNNFQKELQISQEIRMKESELRNFTRHKVKIIEGNIIDNITLIKNDIKKGKKVLIVINTVKQAQDIFRNLIGSTPNSVLLHSRFTLKDREITESSLNNKNLLVGTQVIEVSLDIDYDVLYSEPAPIDALLQRFGRVNRRGKKGISPIYIFSEGSGVDESKWSIYDLARTKRSIAALKKIDVLQESKIQEIVNGVYKEGYSEKELKLFKDTSENFYKFYHSNVPFIDAQKKESDFYNLFKSVEVIPVKFWDQYKTELENKRYFEAMKYTLPISLGQYAYLKNKDRVSNTDRGTIVDAEYDSKFGLLISEQTSATFV